MHRTADHGPEPSTASVITAVGEAFVGVPATLLPLGCPVYLVLITQAWVAGTVAYLFRQPRA